MGFTGSIYLSLSIWYTLPSHLTVIARIGCGLRKEKVGNDRNSRSEKKEVWIGKIEAKKKSLVKCIFVPSFLPNLATLEVPGHTKSQPAQHRKSLGLTYIRPALLNLK